MEQKNDNTKGVFSNVFKKASDLGKKAAEETKKFVDHMRYLRARDQLKKTNPQTIRNVPERQQNERPVFHFRYGYGFLRSYGHRLCVCLHVLIFQPERDAQ